MNKSTKIFVAGHKGFLGSAILKKLIENKFDNLLIEDKKKLNLLSFDQVYKYFKKNNPQIVINAAGNSGNLYQCINIPATLYYVNTTIQNNLFECARLFNCQNLVYYASSCIYPEIVSRKINENDFLSKKIELNTEGYAASKIAGVLACKSYNKQYFKNKSKYIALVPNTLYGPNDNYDEKESHVFSALIKKFYLAKKNNLKNVKLFGSGKPKREFIFTYDVADATIFMLKNYKKLKNMHYNIGPGYELSIKKLAEKIASKYNYTGKIIWDKKYEDGRKRKIISSKLIKKLGWQPQYSFEKSLDYTYDWYINNNK